MKAHFTRLYSSAVAWSWVYNALRVASGLIVLPVLLRVLSKPDLGMHYIFFNLSALGPLMDFGFLNAIHRGISYAMGGAVELKSFGIGLPADPQKGPNFGLLRNLLHTTRILYRFLSAILFLLLGVSGTFLVHSKVAETSNPQLTWAAWVFTLFGTVFDLYSNWWNIYLQGMNHVLESTRILVLCYLFRIVLAFLFLFLGGGLLSLPFASLLSSICIRYLSKRNVLRVLGANIRPEPSKPEIKALLTTLWPNSWRVGVQFFSTYLITNASAFLCLRYFGLTANAEYGLSTQIIGFVSSMAIVWVSVKWPLLGQLRASNNIKQMQTVFWPRLLLQQVSFLFISMAILPLAPLLLQWIGSGKSIMPLHWMLLLAATSFFEVHFRAWCSIISTENRLPYLWAIVFSNLAGFLISVVLIKSTHLGYGSLVLGPLISGFILNYWFWPREGARSLGTSFSRFMVRTGV